MSRNGGAGSSRDGTGQAAGREEESNQLPLAAIVRIMRRVLEPHVKISSSAKNLTQSCAAEFINAVVDEAANQSNQRDRRMLTPADVTWSLQNLGLDRYVEPMGIYLRRYREAASARARGSGSGSTAPAVENITEDELMQIMAQVVNDADAGGNNSSINTAGGNNSS